MSWQPLQTATTVSFPGPSGKSAPGFCCANAGAVCSSAPASTGTMNLSNDMMCLRRIATINLSPHGQRRVHLAERRDHRQRNILAGLRILRWDVLDRQREARAIGIDFDGM